jgi:hypothetical protein
MNAWMQSWSRVTWAMAIGLVLLSVVTLAYVFGPDRIGGWVEALWSSQHGAS